MNNKELRNRTGRTAQQLASSLGLRSPSTIYKWKDIPAWHIIKIESLTGIPREELRPDLYPPRRLTRRTNPTPTQHQKENRV